MQDYEHDLPTENHVLSFKICLFRKEQGKQYLFVE